MYTLVILSMIGSILCQRGHYLRHSLDYYPIPLARRMPLYQELSLIEPRLYAPVIYKSAASGQGRSDVEAVEETQHKEPSNIHEQTNLEADKDIDLMPILSYSSDMNSNGGYSYKYETSDGITREESATIDETGDNNEDGTARRTVRGSYSYPSPDGRIVTVQYIADRDGFRTSGHHLTSAKFRTPFRKVH